MPLEADLLAILESVPDKQVAVGLMATVARAVVRLELEAERQAAVERGVAEALQRRREQGAERQRRWRSNAPSRLSRVTSVTERDAVPPLDPPSSGVFLPGSGISSGSPDPSKPDREDLQLYEPGLLTFPVVGGEGATWDLTAVLRDQHQAAFPDLDVMAEYRKALAYVQSNRPKRKTARGMPTYLFRWLSRAQDVGRSQRPSVALVPLAPARNFREEATAEAFARAKAARGGRT